MVQCILHQLVHRWAYDFLVRRNKSGPRERLRGYKEDAHREKVKAARKGKKKSKDPATSSKFNRRRGAGWTSQSARMASSTVGKGNPNNPNNPNKRVHTKECKVTSSTNFNLGRSFENAVYPIKGRKVTCALRFD